MTLFNKNHKSTLGQWIYCFEDEELLLLVLLTHSSLIISNLPLVTLTTHS